MDDKELLAKIRNPETRNYGFNMLVRSYQQKVYGIARKMVIDHDDADDITQEVFIKVHKSIDTFREDSQLYTWIYRIATNEALTFLNKKRRRLTTTTIFSVITNYLKIFKQISLYKNIICVSCL